MPVPKRKRSRARRDKRFANKGLAVKQFGACSQCQQPIAPHQVCGTCGYYKGKKVMTTKLDRGVKRQIAQKAKEAQQKTVSEESEQ